MLYLGCKGSTFLGDKKEIAPKNFGAIPLIS
jgi:hypothetical protein